MSSIKFSDLKITRYSFDPDTKKFAINFKFYFIETKADGKEFKRNFKRNLQIFWFIKDSNGSLQYISLKYNDWDKYISSFKNFSYKIEKLIRTKFVSEIITLFKNKIVKENFFKQSDKIFLFREKFFDPDLMDSYQMFDFIKCQFDNKSCVTNINFFKEIKDHIVKIKDRTISDEQRANKLNILEKELMQLCLAFLQSDAGFASQFENPELYTFCLNELKTVKKY